MDVIVPTTLTNAMLISSNIPENEYTEWANGGFDALGGIDRNHIGICCSTSGTLWKCVYGGDIYYSTDSGVTWTAYGAGNKNWNGIGSLGTNIYASVKAGSIWMLTAEAGSFTDLAQTTRDWAGMCSCPDGHMWAIVWNGSLYKQTNGSGAFVADVSLSSGNEHYHLHITSTNKFYVSYRVIGDYRIQYRASGSGAFADLGNTVAPYVNQWRGITSNNAGDIIATTNGGSIFVRYAGAGNFTATGETSRAWRGITHDASYNYFAVVYAADVYKATGLQVYAIGDFCQKTSGAPSTHKIYTSLTNFNMGNDPATDTVNWSLVANTNRTAAFDGSIGNQSSQTTLIQKVLAPGLADGLACLNLESDTIRVVEADHSTNKVTNGTGWTGATGTTQPTSWDKIGSPSDYYIDYFNDLGWGWRHMIRITADANGEGLSQTVAVTPGTAMMFNGVYKNTAGDLCQLIIRDMTNAADIIAAKDLPSTTVTAPINEVFTVPAGCTSIKISLLGKTAGDIVWFDDVSLSDVIYDSGVVTTGISKTEYTNISLIQKSDCLIAIIINKATAKVGEIIVGVKTFLGTTKPEPSGGIKDYSGKIPDTFGHYDIVIRDFSKKITCISSIANTLFDGVTRLVNLYRSQALVWIVSADYNATIIYGFYADHKWLIQGTLAQGSTIINWEIEGLT